MLEKIIDSGKNVIRAFSLALGLYGCGDTTIVINNYVGQDGGRSVANDVSRIIDSGNPLDDSFLNDAQPDTSIPYLDGGSPDADLCPGDLQNYPEMFVTDGTFNGYFVIGESAYASDNLAATDIAVSMRYTNERGESVPVAVVDAFKLDSEIASVTAQNLIAVGNPCYNTVSAELLGNPSDCDEGFTPGQGRIKLFHHANGNYALLVAGYSGSDTRLAARVIAHRADELSGNEVIVEGITYSDATIRIPCKPGCESECGE